MGESFEKREKAKKKIKEKQDKAQKMKERKENSVKGRSLEDMMAYVDEYGNISSTPPDGKKPKEVHLDDIQLGAAPITPEALFRTGIVSFFNTEKGYGFIADDKTRENVFVHINQLLDPIKDRDRVSFERERTPKGYCATKVRKL